jgi:uncharacterized membrane protein YgcG
MPRLDLRPVRFHEQPYQHIFSKEWPVGLEGSRPVEVVRQEHDQQQLTGLMPPSMVATTDKIPGFYAASGVNGNHLTANFISIKLAPRRHGRPVYGQWCESVRYILSSPSFLVLKGGAPDQQKYLDAYVGIYELEKIKAVFLRDQALFHAANTELFHIVRLSLDLFGPTMGYDLGIIGSKKFTLDDKYDGLTLVEWVHSFYKTTSVAAQQELLHKLSNAKIGPLASAEVLAAHLRNMLEWWASVTGNDIANPDALWYVIISSLPLSPSNAAIRLMRQQLALAMSRRDTELRDPAAFIESMIGQGALLGVATTAGEAAMAAVAADQEATAAAAAAAAPVPASKYVKRKDVSTRSRSSNVCDTCDSWICLAGGDSNRCVICSDEPIEKLTTASELTVGKICFIVTLRAYKQHMRCGSVKGIGFQTAKEVLTKANKMPDAEELRGPVSLRWAGRPVAGVVSSEPHDLVGCEDAGARGWLIEMGVNPDADGEMAHEVAQQEVAASDFVAALASIPDPPTVAVTGDAAAADATPLEWAQDCTARVSAAPEQGEVAALDFIAVVAADHMDSESFAGTHEGGALDVCPAAWLQGYTPYISVAATDGSAAREVSSEDDEEPDQQSDEHGSWFERQQYRLHSKIAADKQALATAEVAALQARLAADAHAAAERLKEVEAANEQLKADVEERDKALQRMAAQAASPQPPASSATSGTPSANLQAGWGATPGAGAGLATPRTLSFSPAPATPAGSTSSAAADRAKADADRQSAAEAAAQVAKDAGKAAQAASDEAEKLGITTADLMATANIMLLQKLRKLTKKLEDATGRTFMGKMRWLFGLCKWLVRSSRHVAAKYGLERCVLTALVSYVAVPHLRPLIVRALAHMVAVAWSRLSVLGLQRVARIGEYCMSSIAALVAAAHARARRARLTSSSSAQVAGGEPEPARGGAGGRKGHGGGENGSSNGGGSGSSGGGACDVDERATAPVSPATSELRPKSHIITNARSDTLPNVASPAPVAPAQEAAEPATLPAGTALVPQEREALTRGPYRANTGVSTAASARGHMLAHAGESGQVLAALASGPAAMPAVWLHGYSLEQGGSRSRWRLTAGGPMELDELGAMQAMCCAIDSEEWGCWCEGVAVCDNAATGNFTSSDVGRHVNTWEAVSPKVALLEGYAKCGGSFLYTF